MEYNNVSLESDYVLEVTVVKAEGLGRYSKTEKCNSYVGLMIGSENEQSTDVIRRNNDPVWKQTFILYVSDPVNDKLKLQLWNFDSVAGHTLMVCICGCDIFCEKISGVN